MLNYLKQNSELTLFEGVQELRTFEANQNNDRVEVSTQEFKEKLHSHDIIHSLFGCSTDIEGEIKVHLWMLFGTTTKASEIKEALGSTDHKETLKEIGHFKLIRRWMYALPIAFKVFFRSKKMKKKYDIENFRNDLDDKLKDLRNEYKINVI